MAVTIVSGARSTTDLSTYRLKPDIGKGIGLLDPNENPFTLMLTQFATVAATQPKHSWLEDVLQPEYDQIGAGTATSSVATTVYVLNPTYFAVGDIIQNCRTYEIMLVTAMSSVTSLLTITRNYPGVASGHTGYNAAFVASDWVRIVGNVNEEGATSPTAKSTKETQLDNYTQILRTPFDLTETELNSLMEGEQDLPYQVRKKGIEHARQKEQIAIWGLPSTSNTGSSSKPVRTAGGLWHFLKENCPSSQIVQQAELTEAEFLDFIRYGFRYGSRNKVLFAAPIILSAIEKWGLAKLNTYSSDKTYGINVTKWTSPHGEIALVNHKMLEGPDPAAAASIGGGGWAFLLDMSKIKYVPLKGRDTKLLTDRQANDADKKLAEYLTEFTIEVRQPSCHAVLYGVTSFAA